MATRVNQARGWFCVGFEICVREGGLLRCTLAEVMHQVYPLHLGAKAAGTNVGKGKVGAFLIGQTLSLRDVEFVRSGRFPPSLQIRLVACVQGCNEGVEFFRPFFGHIEHRSLSPGMHDRSPLGSYQPREKVAIILVRHRQFLV